MTQLREIKKVIVHDAIIESVTDYIRSSGLAIGERIPSERALAETLKVSRSSVRGAMKSLESAGVLEIRHGGGAYLRSLSSHVYYQYTNDHKENLMLLRDLLQAREALEEWAVAEAAKRASLEEVETLLAAERREFKELERPSPDAADAVALPNMDLEIALMRLTGNAVLLGMHEKIETMWKQTHRKLEMTAFYPRTRYRHHMAILKAIKNRDEKAALDAMRVHNRSLEKYIVAAIEKLEKGE